MDSRFEKGAPLPSQLGQCVDLFREVRDIRLAMQHETDAMEEREKEIKAHIINNVPKGSGGAVGLKYVGTIENEKKIKVSNWPAFHAWLRQNDRLDMLQHRTSDEAVWEWINDQANWIHNAQGQLVARLLPGTEIVNVPKLSVNKK